MGQFGTKKPKMVTKVEWIIQKNWNKPHHKSENI